MAWCKKLCTMAVVFCSLVLGISCGGPEASFNTGPDAQDIYEANRDYEDRANDEAYYEYLSERQRDDYDYPVPDEAELANLAADESQLELFRASVNLNIRTGPGVGYTKIGLMNKGEQCEVSSHSNNDDTWLKVYCAPSREGWVSAEYGEVRLSVNGLTVQTPSVQQGQRSTQVSLCPNGCTKAESGCIIKGNVAFETQERIYHLPSCESYEQTKISPEYGERWFCTETEAVANGWRKAYNCP